MANEIEMTATLTYTNAAAGILAQLLQNVAKKVTIVGKNYAKQRFIVPTAAGGTLIPLGNLATLGRYHIKNLDPANFVTILDAVAGNPINEIPPGESAQGCFPSTVTAPAALGDTDPVPIELLILER